MAAALVAAAAGPAAAAARVGPFLRRVFLRAGRWRSGRPGRAARTRCIMGPTANTPSRCRRRASRVSTLPTPPLLTCRDYRCRLGWADEWAGGNAHLEETMVTAPLLPCFAVWYVKGRGVRGGHSLSVSATHLDSSSSRATAHLVIDHVERESTLYDDVIGCESRGRFRRRECGWCPRCMVPAM